MAEKVLLGFPLEQTFLVKDHILNMFGFGDPSVPVAAAFSSAVLVWLTPETILE